MTSYASLTSILPALCKAEGLVYIGIVELGPEPRFSEFQQWVLEGKNAEMNFLKNHMQCRNDPRNLLAGAKSAIIVSLKYNQQDRGKNPAPNDLPRIAQYARLPDYHKLLKKRAAPIVEALQNIMEPFEYRIVTDSAPLLERALAAQSGSGFIGKNTCYIDSNEGSWLLLGEIILTAKIQTPHHKQIDPATRSPQGGCGTCTRCQINCPTGALEKPYELDARKCLSYYSIEHRGPIPLEYWSHFKSYLFGCDICQAVCPYNRGQSKGEDLVIRIPETPDLLEIAIMNQEYYVKTFAGTPMTRAKKSGLQRNALIAMVVLRDMRYTLAVEHLERAAPEKGSEMLLQTIAQIAEYSDKLTKFNE